MLQIKLAIVKKKKKKKHNKTRYHLDLNRARVSFPQTNHSVQIKTTSHTAIVPYRMEANGVGHPLPQGV